MTQILYLLKKLGHKPEKLRKMMNHIEQPARATHTEQLEENPMHPLKENKYAQTLPAESMFRRKNKLTKKHLRSLSYAIYFR